MEGMERFELAITVLLIILVMVCVYIAASWTLWKKESKSHVHEWLDTGHDEAIHNSISRGFVPEGEEGISKITITPVQPRPDVAEMSAIEASDEDDAHVQGHEVDSHEIELGRLYFALQYDQQRSVLRVRLIRGEDIPLERDISATYVGVRLLPIRLQGEQVAPYETSMNVSFQECYDFHLTQSELARQTLDFHICRYDRFSRKVVIGDVFLALAELGAQGIDITREVYLCRNIINSREAKHVRKSKILTDSEEEDEEDTRNKVERTSNVQENARALWKVVQGAVRKGRFRGLSYPVSQDSPFYWESMFSSGEGENVEYSTSPGKQGNVYYLSGPAPPLKSLAKQQDDQKEEDVVEDIVIKGERSGSFLFPSKSDDDGDNKTVEHEDERELVGPQLQISPAPEEYYTLVPITPFASASPVKELKPRESAVSWHVPETFSSHGPDVVQALAESYTDPRTVTAANLRQTQSKTRPSPEGIALQATSSDSERERLMKNSAEGQARMSKRKHDKVGKHASHKKGRRKISSAKRSKQSPSQTSPDDEPITKEKRTQKDSKRTTKRVVRIRARVERTPSSSSEEKDSITHVKTQPRKTPEGSSTSKTPEYSKEPIIFKARDLEGPFIPPLKDRAQSEPTISEWRRARRTKGSRRQTRVSVSMSDVKDSHIDSSDVSSEFDEY